MLHPRKHCKYTTETRLRYKKRTLCSIKIKLIIVKNIILVIEKSVCLVHWA